MLFEVIPIRNGLLVKKMKFYIQKVCKFNKRHYGGLLTTFLVLSSQLVLITILECYLNLLYSELKEMKFYIQKVRKVNTSDYGELF
jgi:hypothetical protein